MNIELYSHWISTKCTMVQLVGNHVGADLDIKQIDLYPTEENMRDRLQVNVNMRKWTRIKLYSGSPETDGVLVPGLVINDDKVIRDTKDILTYLVDTHSNDDKIYHREPDKRNVIDERVGFALDELADLVSDAYYLDIVRGKPLDCEKVVKINAALNTVDGFLQENEFAAGDHFTIADFCYAVLSSTLQAVSHDLSPFSRICSHLESCKGIIKGWEGIGELRATRFGYWYKATLAAAESGGCPYFPRPCSSDAINETVPATSDIELYSHTSLSPNSTMIQLLARHLGVDLVLKKTELCHLEENEESRREADENWKTMLKHLHFSANDDDEDAPPIPPILVDKGKVITDTATILKYLVKTYASTKELKQLYPSNFVLCCTTDRTLIDDQLELNLDNLNDFVLEAYIICFDDLLTKKDLDQDLVRLIKDVLKRLDDTIQQREFSAGDHLTIADVAFAATLSTLDALDSSYFSEFRRLSTYLESCKRSIVGWEEIGKTAAALVGQWRRDFVDWIENGTCPYYRG